MSNGTSAAAFTQVNDNSRWPRVKYTTVWQVVKVPGTHAHKRPEPWQQAWRKVTSHPV